MKDEIIYGLNSVMEALRGKRRAFELFIAASGNDRRLDKLLSVAAERGVPVRQRDKRDISRLCGTEHHQGVALRAEAFVYVELTDILETVSSDGLLLVLDGVQDPHNLGALIRSAACAGAQAVIIPKDRAVGVTAVVEKASAGAIETIPIVQVTNVAQTLDELKRKNFWIYGAEGQASASIFNQRFSGAVALVIGSEGEGIRSLVKKKCDILVSIPLQGGVNSLNASVAGGIMLFEVVRQRIKNKC